MANGGLGPKFLVIVTAQHYYLRQKGNVFAKLCLSVSQQNNSKSYGRIFLKFWGHVGNGRNYQRFNFGGDPEGILDSGSLWNFRYHYFRWGIREPLANRRWCSHLANNIAFAEVCGLWLLSSYNYTDDIRLCRLSGFHSSVLVTLLAFSFRLLPLRSWISECINWH